MGSQKGPPIRVCLVRVYCTCAGECSAEELERLMTIVANPRNYKIPDWFLNRQRDYKTGRNLHVSVQYSIQGCHRTSASL